MNEPALACAAPELGRDRTVLLAHGEGGRLSRRLLHERILPRLGGGDIADAAQLGAVNGPLAFTTDSFVVTPLFFPGGDIGTLGVCGTINDLAVAGARPVSISLALILEEGLPLETLERVLDSVARAAAAAGVRVDAGDTKVVPRGAADGLFLTTAGVGVLVDPVPPGPAALRPGDELLVTGPLGRHGIAVLAARERLGLEPPPQSDVASLLPAVDALRSAGVPVRALRDATRGGLAAVLHEWADSSGQTLQVEEGRLPVAPEVRGACELLGLDPIYIANEGVMVVAVPAAATAAALAALRTVPVAAAAAPIGAVRPRDLAPVLIRRASGRQVALDEPIAAHLPRIC